MLTVTKDMISFGELFKLFTGSRSLIFIWVVLESQPAIAGGKAKWKVHCHTCGFQDASSKS